MTAARANRGRNLWMLCAMVVLVAAAGILSLRFGSRRTHTSPKVRSSVTVALPQSNLLRPISPQTALRENASRSFSERSDSPAAPFRFEGDASSRDRALECLTQAAYYEAAGDGPDAERAVAQVILNRVRHPGYPPSICGVVYQGSDKPGCQFTFTCDGSLAKPPSEVLWKKAQKIAKEELSGKVFGPVGHATHYHADYVLPYWADSLDKYVQIGQQIFYRLKGVAGEAAAFTQRYSRHEPPLPPPPVSPTVLLQADQLAGGAAPATVDPVAPATPLATPEQSPLLADTSAGTLIVDGGGAKAPSRAPRNAHPSTETCAGTTTTGELQPLAPNDLRSNANSACGD